MMLLQRAIEVSENKEMSVQDYLSKVIKVVSLYFDESFFIFLGKFPHFIRFIAIIEPVLEKTNNLGLRPGLTQTRLYSHRSRLEA